MHNDDHTPFAVVWHLIRKVCELDANTAYDLTNLIHHSGRAVVGAYDRDAAESVALRFVRAGVRATVLRGVMTGDEPIFTAERVDGGVRVMVPEEFARAWEPAFRLLENLYRRNAIVYGLRFPRPAMTRRPFLRRMFPDVAGSRWRSALVRRRNRELLADRALVDRVWDQWINAESLVLTTAEAEDWIVVFGQIRAVHLQLRKATALHFHILAHIQHQLVAAVDPEVHVPEQAPGAVTQTAPVQPV
ncbi:hypothetical protein Lesp01_53080 [Lentzea sp. NBRC 102530]|nr:hypothetical protein Lesp01_53080 [Lentzea sp. NBRC 102530]